jgi:hypothetical protein
VGRREAWWANFLLGTLGIVIFVLTILLFLAGLGSIRAS